MCLLHQPMVFSRPSGMGIFIAEYEIDIHEKGGAFARSKVWLPFQYHIAPPFSLIQ